jgi:hypothetical protein
MKVLGILLVVAALAVIILWFYYRPTIEYLHNGSNEGAQPQPLKTSYTLGARGESVPDSPYTQFQRIV